MSCAPERIWAAPPYDDPEWKSGAGEWDVSEDWAASEITQYIRADIVQTFLAVQPDAREAALREALAAVNAKWRSGADTPDEMRGLALAEAAILALLDKPGHVNETPKREHVLNDVLTRAAKGIAHD